MICFIVDKIIIKLFTYETIICNLNVFDIVFALTGNYIIEITRVKVYNYRTKFQVYSQVVTKRLNEIWFHLTTPYFSNHNYLWFVLTFQNVSKRIALRLLHLITILKSFTTQFARNCSLMLYHNTRFMSGWTWLCTVATTQRIILAPTAHV